jgi:hypothetical protein
MLYTSSKNFNLIGYSDSDWGRDFGWKEKHNRICLFYRRYIFHMVIQEAIDSNVIKLWSRVCCC